MHKNLNNTGITITDQGDCYLRAIIGAESFREQLIKNKIEGWLGLTNPQTTAKTEYTYSMLITAKLTDQIHNQNRNLESGLQSRR